MSEIAPDAEPMSLFEIDPVGPGVDSGHIAGISCKDYVSSGDGEVAEFSDPGLHSDIKMEHLPASGYI